MKKTKKIVWGFALPALIAGFGSVAGFAQSSGNFSATATAASCEIGAGGKFSGGTGVKIFSANISTSNGSGVTLNIRPSLVTGLFTQSKVDTTIATASADTGIEVCVTVDGVGDGVLPKSCVVYDQRFQQVSSQLFSQLTVCQPVTTTIACTADASCITALGVGATCNNPAGGVLAGVCVGPPNLACNIDLILSTLSAHSFDFVVPVDNKKSHVVQASWKVIGAGPSGTNSSVASCVGPGILTVTQQKVFNNSGALLTF